MAKKKDYSKTVVLRGVAIVSVIEVKASVTSDDPADPSRVVTQWWTQEGEFIGGYDPWDAETKTMKIKVQWRQVRED